MLVSFVLASRGPILQALKPEKPLYLVYSVID